MKFFYCIFTSLLFFSCTEEAPETLLVQDRNLIDSLYLKEVSKLKPELDSLCELNFDKRVAGLVDSILQERQEEIEEQVRRLQEIKRNF
ncbi:MAG: hypothetical protein ACI85O_000034 [Saprospiraceae bacterium]|jgi:hypothetical protein